MGSANISGNRSYAARHVGNGVPSSRRLSQTSMLDLYFAIPPEYPSQAVTDRSELARVERYSSLGVPFSALHNA